MENDFNSVWDTLAALNTIGPDVTIEIDILKGANPEFINFVSELECMTDFEARANKAKKYIEDNNGLKEIDYPTLGKYLLNPKAVPLDIWRKLYVLERSIPPRFGDKYTWVERLKMFYNTYVRETAIDGKVTYNNKKIYQIKGNKDRPTNHNKLVYGHGQWGADFYFYDDNIEGSTWQKMIKVEMKHGNSNIDVEIKNHAEDKFLYGAKYLILAMSDGSYYMINYNKEPAEATKLDVICPDVFKF